MVKCVLQTYLLGSFKIVVASLVGHPWSEYSTSKSFYWRSIIAVPSIENSLFILVGNPICPTFLMPYICAHHQQMARNSLEWIRQRQTRSRTLGAQSKKEWLFVGRFFFGEPPNNDESCFHSPIFRRIRKYLPRLLQLK